MTLPTVEGIIERYFSNGKALVIRMKNSCLNGIASNTAGYLTLLNIIVGNLLLIVSRR
jgi:hypothetical protein